MFLEKHLYNQFIKCKYVLKHYPSSNHFCNKFTLQFCLDVYILLNQFNTLQMLMFIYPAILELCVYECFHPCLERNIWIAWRGGCLLHNYETSCRCTDLFV